MRRLLPGVLDCAARAAAGEARLRCHAGPTSMPGCLRDRAAAMGARLRCQDGHRCQGCFQAMRLPGPVAMLGAVDLAARADFAARVVPAGTHDCAAKADSAATGPLRDELDFSEGRLHCQPEGRCQACSTSLPAPTSPPGAAMAASRCARLPCHPGSFPIALDRLHCKGPCILITALD